MKYCIFCPKNKRRQLNLPKCGKNICCSYNIIIRFQAFVTVQQEVRILAEPKRNITEYVRWRGDIGFDRTPICEADYLVLSQLSYMPFDELVPEAHGEGVVLGEILPDIIKRLRTGDGRWLFFIDENIEFLEFLSDSERFSTLSVSGYENIINPEKQEQFAAITFRIPDGGEKRGSSYVITFRGTDSTLIGWKEDFNMAFSESVPAQLDAVTYIEKTARAFPDGKLYVCGHSKGGNLAVYGSAFCSEYAGRRIVAIRNLDGPGFLGQTVKKKEFAAIVDRLVTVVPSSSMVGLLLEHAENITVIHSYASNIAFQHNPFSWQIERCSYVVLEEISDMTRYIGEAMSAFLSKMSPEMRERFVDGIFDTITRTGIDDVRDIFSGKNIITVLRAMKSADSDTSAVLSEAFSVFRSAAGVSLPALVEKLTKKS